MNIDRAVLSLLVQYPVTNPGACDTRGTSCSCSALSAASGSVIARLTTTAYLSPQDARPYIDRIPTATVHEMPAGHGPWLVDPARVAGLIAAHLQHTASLGDPTAVRSEAPT
jgi:hypothetical protein